MARWRCIGENEARAWAEQIGVSKVGAAFAWTRDDVQDLLDQLDACDDESAAECPAPDDDDDAEEAAEDDEEDD